MIYIKGARKFTFGEFNISIDTFQGTDNIHVEIKSNQATIYPCAMTLTSIEQVRHLEIAIKEIKYKLGME